MPHIMVVGGVTLDITFDLPHWPEKHDVVHTDTVMLSPGGKGLNEAVAVRRLGADVTMVGSIGHDLAGDMVLHTLRNEGVDTTFIHRHPQLGTGIVAVLLAEGYPGYIGVRRASEKVQIDAIQSAAGQLTPESVVLVNYEITQEAVDTTLRLAKQAGATTVLNPAPLHTFPANTDHLRLVDYLIPNISEARYMLHDTEVPLADLPGRLLDTGAGAVCITLGEDGCLFVDGAARDTVLRQPALPVKVVDTTGASDAFCAAFAFGTASKWDVSQRLRFATAAAAKACTQYGAMPSMPYRQDVDALL